MRRGVGAARQRIEIQTAEQRLFAQIPGDRVGCMLPHRPRSYTQLAYHIFNIADAFLEHEVQGRRRIDAVARGQFAKRAKGDAHDR